MTEMKTARLCALLQMFMIIAASSTTPKVTIDNRVGNSFQSTGKCLTDDELSKLQLETVYTICCHHGQLFLPDIDPDIDGQSL